MNDPKMQSKMSKNVVKQDIFAEKVAKRPLPNKKSNEKYPKTSRCAAVKTRTYLLEAGWS